MSEDEFLKSEEPEGSEESKPLFYDPGSEAHWTDEQLQEMRALGMPKPDDVEWGRWIGPKNHSHRHGMLIYLAASGLTGNEIAKELRLTPSRVSVILSQPKIKNKIKEVQQEFWGDRAEERFKQLIPKAINVLEATVDNQQEKTPNRLTAAKEILDRSLGKAQQKVSVEGNLLGDLIDRFDRGKTVVGETIDVTAVEKPKDEMDTMLDSFIETDHVVGKKGEINES